MIVDTVVNTRMQAAFERVSCVSRTTAGRELPPTGVGWKGNSPNITESVPQGLIGTTIEDLLLASFEALDLLDIGLVVCNASGHVLIANQTAGHILRNRDGLEIDRDGMLQSTHTSSSALSELVERVARDGQNGEAFSPDAALSVSRGPHKRALTLQVHPAKADMSSVPPSQQAAALVMIVDSARPVQAAASELRQLYGLTSTEARLANLLMEGRDLDECCDQLGIQRSTVRMHRRNLFSKIGVRRQSELVSLLMKSIGLGPRDK
jgi:DNA-binding CsgD family transcriptional regulator